VGCDFPRLASARPRPDVACKKERVEMNDILIESVNPGWEDLFDRMA
jgi:hypothetical protein